MPAPDIEPIEDPHFAAPIVFEMRDGAFIAKLGSNEVGQVVPHDGGRNIRAYWIWFAGSRRLAPAPSVQVAAERLVECARRWFADCGYPLPKAGFVLSRGDYLTFDYGTMADPKGRET